nr:collagen alpha-1(III) chain-like [Vulpes vulpes]
MPGARLPPTAAAPAFQKGQGLAWAPGAGCGGGEGRTRVRPSREPPCTRVPGPGHSGKKPAGCRAPPRPLPGRTQRTLARRTDDPAARRPRCPTHLPGEASPREPCPLGPRGPPGRSPWCPRPRPLPGRGTPGTPAPRATLLRGHDSRSENKTNQTLPGLGSALLPSLLPHLTPSCPSPGSRDAGQEQPAERGARPPAVGAQAGPAPGGHTEARASAGRRRKQHSPTRPSPGRHVPRRGRGCGQGELGRALALLTRDPEPASPPSGHAAGSHPTRIPGELSGRRAHGSSMTPSGRGAHVVATVRDSSGRTEDTWAQSRTARRL